MGVVAPGEKKNWNEDNYWFYFLLAFSDLFLPAHCSCRELLLHLVMLSDRHSIGLLWTRDRPIAATSTWQHTTLNKTQTCIPRPDFEPTSPAYERPQIHALDRAATGVGVIDLECKSDKIKYLHHSHECQVIFR